MIGEAFLVMLLGMTGVFVFLLALVGLMNLIANWTADPPADPATRPTPSAASDGLPDDLVAVLQAAVVAYETDRSSRT